jgi:hypothetical protein
LGADEVIEFAVGVGEGSGIEAFFEIRISGECLWEGLGN